MYCFSPFFGEDWANFDLLASKVARSLKTGGKFVLDLFDWNSMEVGTSFQEWQFPKPKNKIILSKYKRNERKIVCKRLLVLPDFETKEFELYWRIFDREELLEIMTKAGLKLIHECYNFDLNKQASWQPQLTKQRLVVVFEKI